MTDILQQAKTLIELREKMRPENKPSLLDMAKLGDFMNDHREHPFEFARALLEAVEVMRDVRDHMVSIGKRDGYTVYEIEECFKRIGVSE